VTYADGQVDSPVGSRLRVGLGEPVSLTVRSDVAEVVHVHGYDLERAVPAGGSATLTFPASIPGVFAVELHESGDTLLRLEVR